MFLQSVPIKMFFCKRRVAPESPETGYGTCRVSQFGGWVPANPKASSLTHSMILNLQLSTVSQLFKCEINRKQEKQFGHSKSVWTVVFGLGCSRACSGFQCSSWFPRVCFQRLLGSSSVNKSHHFLTDRIVEREVSMLPAQLNSAASFSTSNNSCIFKGGKKQLKEAPILYDVLQLI